MTCASKSRPIVKGVARRGYVWHSRNPLPAIQVCPLAAVDWSMGRGTYTVEAGHAADPVVWTRVVSAVREQTVGGQGVVSRDIALEARIVPARRTVEAVNPQRMGPLVCCRSRWRRDAGFSTAKEVEGAATAGREAEAHEAAALRAGARPRVTTSAILSAYARSEGSIPNRGEAQHPVVALAYSKRAEPALACPRRPREAVAAEIGENWGGENPGPCPSQLRVRSLPP